MQEPIGFQPEGEPSEDELEEPTIYPEDAYAFSPPVPKCSNCGMDLMGSAHIITPVPLCLSCDMAREYEDMLGEEDIIHGIIEGADCKFPGGHE